ncbi:hypothetical protein TNCV_2949911 [Trichonephila clavipes]|nr:hypothetical protein TNCV_2949911 [Trichonephila clavipes]
MIDFTSTLQDSFSAQLDYFEDDKKMMIFHTTFFLISLQDVNCHPPKTQIGNVDLSSLSTEKNCKELISTARHPKYVEFWKVVPKRFSIFTIWKSDIVA